MNEDSFSPEKNDIQQLAKQKEIISEELEHSLKFLTHLEHKRKNLRSAIRQKLLQAKTDEIRKTSELKKDLYALFQNAGELFRNGEFEKTIQACSQILVLDSGHESAKLLLADAQKQLKLKEEEHKIQKELFHQKEKRRQELFLEAKRKFRETRFEECLQVLEQIIFEYGRTPEIMELVSNCENKIEQFKQDDLKIKEAQQKINEQTSKWIQLAQKYFLSQELHKAKEFYEKAVLIDPENSEASEGLIRTENKIRESVELEQQHQEERRNRFLLLTREAEKLVQSDYYLEAIQKYESVIPEYSGDELESILNKIGELEKLQKNKEEKEKESKRKLEELENQKKKLREQFFWENIYKAEVFLKEKKYFECSLHLKQLIEEFPEKEEIRLKLNEVTHLADLELEERKMKDFHEREEKHKMLSLLDEAEKFLWNQQIPECEERCLAVIRADKYEVTHAKVLFEQCQKKKEELESQKILREQEKTVLEKEAVKKAFFDKESEFNQFILSNELNQACKVLTELKMIVSKDEDLKKNLKVLEDAYIQKANQLREEMVRNKTKFTELFNRGMQLYQNSEYWQAYTFFKEASYLFPDDHDARQFKEKTLEKISDLEKRREEDAQNKKEFETHFERLKIQIACLLKEKKFTEALEECAKLSMLYPGDERVIHEIEKIEARAEAYEVEKKSQQLKMLEEQKAKKNSLINELLVKAQMAVHLNEFDEAFQHLYEALRLSPADKTVLSLLEEVQNQKEKFYQNSEAEKNLINERTVNAEKMIYMARKYDFLGDYEVAIKYYEKALETDPLNDKVKIEIRALEKKMIEKQTQAQMEEQEMRDRLNEWTLEASRSFFHKKYSEALFLCEKILLYQPENQKIESLKNQVLNVKKNEDLLESERKEQEENRVRAEKEKVSLEAQNKVTEIRNVHQAGLEFFREREYERAIEEWEKIRFIDPSHPLINEEIRRAKLKIKELEISEVQEKENRKQNETKANQLWLEGRGCLREDAFIKAIECFEKAILLVGRERHLLEELEKANQLLMKRKTEDDRKRLLEEKRKKSISQLIFMGTRYFNNQQYKESIRLWEKALMLDPELDEAKNGIINAEQRIKEKNEVNKVEKNIYPSNFEEESVEKIIETVEKMDIEDKNLNTSNEIEL